MDLKKNPITSVNFHFWSHCNFKCKYCFAKFNQTSQKLSKRQCLEIIKTLTIYKTKKLNFAGGEPTLCPFLGDLILFSKRLGLTTSIISNGTGITQNFIDNYRNAIDWIGLSLDSGNENVQKKLGRGKGNYVNSIIRKCELIKAAGIKLKINSVITRLNFLEDISEIIEKIEPNRWKIFQVLEIKNQNSSSVKDLLISQADFNIFVNRHEHLNPIVENNESMTESYMMIDPTGKFYQNSENIYSFSRPILEVGVVNALNDIKYNHKMFLERGGLYVW